MVRNVASLQAAPGLDFRRGGSPMPSFGNGTKTLAALDGLRA